MSQTSITTVYQGDTVNIGYRVQEPEGTAQDLTGCQLRWGYAAQDAVDVPLLTKTHLSGITILDALAGHCRVEIAAGELSTPGHYVHELELKLPSGETTTVAQGPFVVKPAVYPVGA